MQVSRQDLHREITSIHDLYKNYARFKTDHNLLQRKYKSCLLSLKTVRSENQALTDNFASHYVSKEVHESVIKEREEFRLQYVNLKNDYNDSINDTQISYQSTCDELNNLKNEHKLVLRKCQELKSRNQSLENLSLSNQQLKEENEDLRRELDECKKICSKSLKENEQLRCSVKLHDDLKKKYAVVSSSNQDFTRECDRMRCKIQSLDATIHNMRQSQLEDQRKLTDLTADNENLSGMCASLRNECVQIKKQLETQPVQQPDKFDVSSFDLQKKYDKSVRDRESFLLDIRQLLAKYDKVKEDDDEYPLTTESKFNCKFIPKDMCDDPIALSQSIPYIKKTVKQENRNSQVINNKYEIRKLISDSPTLEQSMHDVLTDEDDDMLRFIFNSAKFSVSLLSPIPSPVSHDNRVVDIAKACSDDNEVCQLDVSIGMHQPNCGDVEEASIILSGTSSSNVQVLACTIDTVNLTEIDKTIESGACNDNEICRMDVLIENPDQVDAEGASVISGTSSSNIKTSTGTIETVKIVEVKQSEEIVLHRPSSPIPLARDLIASERITPSSGERTTSRGYIRRGHPLTIDAKTNQVGTIANEEITANADGEQEAVESHLPVVLHIPEDLTCVNDQVLKNYLIETNPELIDFELNSNKTDIADSVKGDDTEDKRQTGVIDDELLATNASVEILPEIRTELQVDQTKKSKTVSDSENVDSAFGSTCSSDDELTGSQTNIETAMLNFELKLKQLADSNKTSDFNNTTDNNINVYVSIEEDINHELTLGFQHDHVVIANQSKSVICKIGHSPRSEKTGFVRKYVLRKRKGFVPTLIESHQQLSETKKIRLSDTPSDRVDICAVTLGESDIESASPASPEPCRDDVEFSPVIIPTHKARDMSFVKGRQLLQDMLQYCQNNNVVFEVARKFLSESPAFIGKLILQLVSTDIHDTPTKGEYPMEPHLTVIQKGLYKFMMALEKLGVDSVCQSFFQEADLYLRCVDSPVLLEPVTRLYVAICKGKCDYWQVRMALCSALADMGDLAIPYTYIVLQTWIEVLPRNDIPSHNHVLPKTILQLVLLKKLSTPGYNLINLRLLLFNYYKFSSDGDDSKKLFKELIECYIAEQNECARVLAIALSEYVDVRLVVKEVFTNLLSDVSPTVTVQRVNAVITLVIHFTKHLSDKVDGASLQANIEWLRQFSTATYPYAVQEHAKQMLNWFVRCDSVPYNILERV